MRRYLLIFTIVSIALFVGEKVHAYVPNMVVQKSQQDIVIVTDPELYQTFYGEMTGTPHTFEIDAKKSFTLSTQILVPDIETTSKNISGIIIKIPREGGRVQEIARLGAKDAPWNSTFMFISGDTYLEGPQFEKELDPGMYHIEVHTGDNTEKYVLSIGNRDEGTLGYFELLKRMKDVKNFFGKSSFRVIESPLVYVPVFLIVCVVFIFVMRRRRQHKV